MKHFEILNSIDVSGRIEEKENGNTKLKYLSWAWAWAETKKKFPEAKYEVIKHNGLPYVHDEKTGYMVFTWVEIEGIKHEMWLPVMDCRNKSMKSKPYTYKSKKWNKNLKKYEYFDVIVESASMFDINKTIMRCLTKNLAMFGMGLYIYAGEDLPEQEDDTSSDNKDSKNNQNQKQQQQNTVNDKDKVTQPMLKRYYAIAKKQGVSDINALNEKVKKVFGIESKNDWLRDDYRNFVEFMEKHTSVEIFEALQKKIDKKEKNNVKYGVLRII